MKTSFMVGSDPELFIGTPEGKVISAIGKFGGTKEEPLRVIRKGFSIQEDNVLLEYNTPPAKSVGAFGKYQAEIRDYLGEQVDKLGFKILPIASASLEGDQLADPRAWVFGCDPDYNVWTGEMNPKPHSPDETLRSAGGHVHVGVIGLTVRDKIRLGRLLDLFVGTTLSQIDPDKRRRELYGKAGAIRFKPYGLEYRTPSNFWTFSEQGQAIVWDGVRRAVSSLGAFHIDENDNPIIQHAVNTGDVGAYAHLKARYRLTTV